MFRSGFGSHLAHGKNRNGFSHHRSRRSGSFHPHFTNRIIAFLFLLLWVAMGQFAIGQTPSQNDPWRQAIDRGLAAEKNYDFDAAMKHYRQAVALSEPRGEGDRRFLESRARLLNACWAAEECEDEILPTATKLLHARKDALGDDLESARILDLVADVAASAELHEEALACNSEALALRVRLLGPKDAAIAETRVKRAWLLSDSGKKQEARAEMDAALRVADPADGKATRSYADTLRESAELYNAHGETGDAHQTFDRYLLTLAKVRKVTDPEYIEELQRVAASVSYDDDPSFAEMLYKQAVELSRKSAGNQSMLCAKALDKFGGFLQKEERWKEAQSTYREALQIYRKRGFQDYDTAGLLQSLAEVLQAQEQYPEAIALARECLEIHLLLRPDPRSNPSGLRARLSTLYASNGQYDEAETEFKLFASPNRKDRSQWVGRVADELSGIYEKRGKLDLAAAKLEDSVAIDESFSNIEPAERADKLIRLAKLYQRLGRSQESQRVSMQAMGITLGEASQLAKSNDVRNGILIGLAVFLLVGAAILVGGAFGYATASSCLEKRLAALYEMPSPGSDANPEAASEGTPPSTNVSPGASITPEEFEAAVGALLALPPRQVTDDATPAVDAHDLSEIQPDPELLEIATGPTGEIPGEECGPVPADCAHDGESGVGAAVPPHGIQGAEDSTTPPPPVPNPAMSVASPPLHSTVPGTPVTAFRFLGDGSTLFEIRVRNLLFSLLTLGGYSFWGKAIVRRYLCGQIELEGDRLVFLGNGKELLLGWLKAVPVLAFLVLFPSVLPLFWQTPNALWVGQLVVIAAVLLLWPVALVGAYRYRMNRMSWRGIRFSFRGSTLRYLGLNVGGYLLIVLTLGMYTPYFIARKERFLRNGTYFGDRAVAFDGKGSDLFWPFLSSLPLIAITYWFFLPWYSALCSRYLWAHTTYAGIRFRCTVNGADLLWIWVSNFVLVFGTLGLGSSWATSRSLEFWTRRIHLVGVPDLNGIRQDAQVASATGESFADYLGFDFGL